MTPCTGNMKFGEMELGEMKRNTSNRSNFCMLASRGFVSVSWDFLLSLNYNYIIVILYLKKAKLLQSSPYLTSLKTEITKLSYNSDHLGYTLILPILAILFQKHNKKMPLL